MMRKKGYKPQHLKCGEILIPQSGAGLRLEGCRKSQYERPAKFFKARIKEMIQNDPRVTVSEISSELGLSYSSVQHIASDGLRYSGNTSAKT
ncbi:hypothetical protein TNCV_3992341 [Trichonephila clavipes]|uniref:Uncharacterized protein n=1 Tax=Trichonephila clavipes TaxID=2585209 RepID=A0A8X6T058_TRICX|nr:hypothetical protein TNCV_3992341 [Trichonephila clavipes]